MKRLTSRPPNSAALPFGGRELSVPDQPAGVYVAYVDGASRGNPGPASYAVVLQAPDGATKFEIGKYVGRATNNVAEYYGLIAALDYAASEKIHRLRVRSDSQLLVRQMQGRYKVNSPDLRPLHERAQKLARALAYFTIEHIPREQNSEADELANIALDRTAAGGAAANSSPAHMGASPSRTQAAGPAARPRGDRRIRARFSAGALHPLEALDLAEGEVVEIQIGRNSQKA
jgi:ribonuclease HI